jgi:hypothetical protein
MPYASEAAFRAAVEAYSALHTVFYRFHKAVREQPPPATPRGSAGSAGGAGGVRDYRLLVETLVPALARAYAGPPIFVERLADTMRLLGERHQNGFDVHLVQQAYVDVDNVLQDLLRERQHYPQAFDDAFSGLRKNE